jgi:ABC-type polysaccharide/polyol phosphate transport system ATPase subunit
MQVRLAYSIAIQVDFDILLLDEVLAVGDQAFQDKCYATFKQFREDGKTIVLVTHGLGTLEEHAERVLLMRGGRVEMIGEPSSVVAEYRRNTPVLA